MTTTAKIVAVLSDKPRYSYQKNLDVLTRFTIKGSYSWSGLGYVAEGDEGRQVDSGPLVPGPWAYGFPLGHCMAANPEMGTGAEQRRLRERGLLIEVEGGEEVEIAGITYVVRIQRSGRDAWVHLDASK